MSGLKIHLTRRKKPLIILAAIVLLAAISVVAVWLVASQRLTADYRTQRASYVSGLKQKLDSAQEVFKKAASTADSAVTIGALSGFGDAFLKQTNSAPQLPSLFGISLASPQDQADRAGLVSHAQDLAKDVQDAHQLLLYEHTVAALMQQAANKTGHTAAEQQALADAWHDIVTQLGKVTVPTAAKNVHAQLVSAASSIQATLATLPDLFNKKDVNGFTAKQKELDTNFATLRSLSPSFKDLQTTADKYIARDYQAVLDALH